MQPGGLRAGTGCEAGAEMGAGVEAGMGAGTNQTVGEAQWASWRAGGGQGGPAAVSRGGAHLDPAFPPATALGVRGQRWAASAR